MRIENLSFIIIIGLILSSCSFLSGQNENDVYKKSSNVKHNFNLVGWNHVKIDDRIDLAFKNTVSKSLIIVNSNCRKNNISTLQSLKSSIIAGIENLEIENESTVTIHGRDTLQTILSGSLDGVKRFMKLTIFQRDYCIYDLFLIAQDKNNLNRDLADYDKLVQEAFEFK